MRSFRHMSQWPSGLVCRLARSAVNPDAPRERDQMIPSLVLPHLCPFDPPMLGQPLPSDGR